ncbi:hypothetical protein BCF59_0338 [Mycoplasmopsis mustelae]|uniref:Uncharacterized protein n=1 Tax=Mycoplasmopsis mustelae TaxID=171289 RepID=A0A4R7UER4_9BACT|nr:hypothetical protein [Mycoplasmopsis mustelae]TDV24373.1 hypothetical protein BCF59_0338 [Mycoplasmopsis mustelae]
MSSKVIAKCDLCNKNYYYVFGFSKELALFDIFLSKYEKEQVDLFVEDKFIEYFNKEMNENSNEYQQLTEEKKKELLKQNYHSILEFFQEDEIKLIKSNILISHELEFYPVITVNENPTEREIFNIPLIKLFFLNGKKYNREYDTNTIWYVQFTKDQKQITCPYHLKMTANVIAEGNPN